MDYSIYLNYYWSAFLALCGCTGKPLLFSGYFNFVDLVFTSNVLLYNQEIVARCFLIIGRGSKEFAYIASKL